MDSIKAHVVANIWGPGDLVVEAILDRHDKHIGPIVRCLVPRSWLRNQTTHCRFVHPNKKRLCVSESLLRQHDVPFNHDLKKKYGQAFHLLMIVEGSKEELRCLRSGFDGRAYRDVPVVLSA